MLSQTPSIKLYRGPGNVKGSVFKSKYVGLEMLSPNAGLHLNTYKDASYHT